MSQQISLLPLEFGVAREVLRHSPEAGLLVDPLTPQRAGFVLLAAHTVLPEASVLSLPVVARDELAAGLAGPIRSAFANYAVPDRDTSVQEPAARDDTYLSALVADLLLSLTGLANLDGALTLASRIHMARAVRGTVSALVATGCLAWYAGYVDERLSSAGPIIDAQVLMDAWTHDPLKRSSIEMTMARLAQSIAGKEPADLLDVAV